MQRFGSYSEYRQAPSRTVEEQIEVWRAERQADADNHKEATKTPKKTPSRRPSHRR